MFTYSRQGSILALLCVFAALIGLPGLALAQSDQILPPIGGHGGGQFFARCPYPDLLTGFQLRTGDDVDAIRAICVHAFGPNQKNFGYLHPTTHGGNGGTVVHLECPRATPAVNGIKVGYEGEGTVIVNSIHVYCSPAAANQPLTSYPTLVFDGSEIRRVKGGVFTGDTPVPLYEHRQECPPGLFAVGINGRSGIWLDSVGLICGLANVGPVAAPPGMNPLGPKGKQPLTACEAVRAARANNRTPPTWLVKQCVDSTAVVKQAERAGPIVSAGGAPVVVTATAVLDELAGRGDGIASQDPLFTELRNRMAEGAALRGFDIGMAAAEGQTQTGPGKQKIHDSLNAAEQQGFEVAMSISLQRNRNARLAQVGAFLASADPVVAEARVAESDVFYWLGFDIASGIFGDPAGGAQGNTATGPGSLRIRDALNPAAQRGFDAAVALHLQRDYR